MPTVLIRTPNRGPWLELAAPVAILTAARADSLPALLAEVEAQAAGGYLVAGYVTYEAAAAFDLPVQPAPGRVPLAWFGLFRPADAVLHERVPDHWHGPRPRLAWHPSVDPRAYEAAVARLHEHIGEGDAYQLNYTFRMRTEFSGDPRALFAALDAAQGGAWSAFIDTGDLAVCSASPELFFARDGRRLITRPMKGTVPRGRTPEEDAVLARTLTESAKNRAENVMIVDLMRNDVGRIARPGSVAVTALFEAERYPAQWQMTSTVEAELIDGAGLPAIFGALFPAGSVTGAPKIRSMQILADIEDAPRGLYCGAIGLVEPEGRAHFNVAIRTVTVDRRAGTAEFGVGSGIVWDSDAASEFEECRLKAAILTTPEPAFALVESLRWEPGAGYARTARHRARMAASADYFGFPFDAPAFDAALARAAGALSQPAKVRVLLARDGGITVDVRALDPASAPVPVPLRVALADRPVDPADVFLFHKTTRRDAYERADAAKPPGVDTVVLWNTAGEVTEAVNFNVVAEIDGRAVTPPVACGLLAGTLRAELLDAGTITERTITVADLRAAARLWLINSVRGRVEATLVDGPPSRA
ncbi:MAG: aminodeoxychorismate synthase component I [Vicinamibacterales bacterium]